MDQKMQKNVVCAYLHKSGWIDLHQINTKTIISVLHISSSCTLHQRKRIIFVIFVRYWKQFFCE